MKTWPVIEHDQNNGLERIYDMVTAEHVAQFREGEEVMVVCVDGREPDGAADFGYGFIAVVNAVVPCADGSGRWMVYAMTRERWDETERVMASPEGQAFLAQAREHMDRGERGTVDTKESLMARLRREESRANGVGSPDS